MNLIRNEQQLALHDLLVASRKTADHYRDAAEFLHSGAASDALRQIASERERLSERLVQATRDSGDLPSLPDEDRESIEKLLHHMHANLSNDEARDVLRQRLDAEQALAHMLAAIHDSGAASKADTALLTAMGDHVQFVIKRLQQLLQ